MKPLILMIIFSALLAAAPVLASEPAVNDDPFQDSLESTDTGNVTQDAKVPSAGELSQPDETNVICDGACNKQ
jgi:hypothetical protein